MIRFGVFLAYFSFSYRKHQYCNVKLIAACLGFFFLDWYTHCNRIPPSSSLCTVYMVKIQCSIFFFKRWRMIVNLFWSFQGCTLLSVAEILKTVYTVSANCECAVNFKTGTEGITFSRFRGFLTSHWNDLLQSTNCNLLFISVTGGRKPVWQIWNSFSLVFMSYLLAYCMQLDNTLISCLKRIF